MGAERKARVLDLLVQIEDKDLERGYISEIAEGLSTSKAWISELLKSAEDYGYVKIQDVWDSGSSSWVRRITITEKGRACVDKWAQVKEACSKPYMEYTPPILVSGRGKRVRRRERLIPALKEVRGALGLGRTEGAYYKLARYVYDRFGIHPLCLKR